MSGQHHLLNILITGTPGVGKSSLCTDVVDCITSANDCNNTMMQCQHIDVGRVVKEKGLHEGKDEELDTLILDEDACLDHLEEILGNVKDDNRFVVNVVDYHSCDLFPERWFNLVLVLRSDTNILYDRLSNRGYSEKKIMENIQCEIFNVVEEEAKDSYNDDVVVVRRSNTVDDMDSNREKVVQYIITWMNQRNTINSN